MAAVLDEGSLPILTAVVNPGVEAALVAGFGRQDLGVTVVRRCVDIVELLSAAAAGTAEAVLVSADLRGLDRESVELLSRAGLAIVALASDENEERLLHQLAVDLVLPTSAPPEQAAGALRAAATTLLEAGDVLLGDSSRSAGRTRRSEAESPAVGEPVAEAGSLLAVWGPTGAPGRSTLALGLADALAQRKISVLLIDADSYGGSLATLAGLLDESPGITAACRAANAGTLDVARLAGYCSEVSPFLRVLTGLRQASRWPELKPAALEVVLALSRRLADVVIVDCGFSLEDDEELSYDTLAPRRNAATLTSLRSADRIIAIGAADPVGLSRLVRELPYLASVLGGPVEVLAADGRLIMVANRVRDGLLPGSPVRGVVDALAVHAGISPYGTLPMDVAAADAAHGRGQLLSEAAPGSSFFFAVRGLAEQLFPDVDAPRPSRKALRRRRFGRRRRAMSTSR